MLPEFDINKQYRTGDLVRSYAGEGEVELTLPSYDPQNYPPKAKLRLADGTRSHWINFTSLTKFNPKTDTPRTKAEAIAFWKFWATADAGFHPDDYREYDEPLRTQCEQAWQLQNAWGEEMEAFYSQLFKHSEVVAEEARS